MNIEQNKENGIAYYTMAFEGKPRDAVERMHGEYREKSVESQ